MTAEQIRKNLKPDRKSWIRDLANETKRQTKIIASTHLLKNDGFEVVSASELRVGDLVVVLFSTKNIGGGYLHPKYYFAEGQSMLNGQWLSFQQKQHPRAPLRPYEIILDIWFTGLTVDKVKSGRSLRQANNYHSIHSCTVMNCIELRKKDASSKDIEFFSVGETFERWATLPMPQANKAGLIRQWVVRKVR